VTANVAFVTVITIVPLPFTSRDHGCPLAPFLFLPFKFVAVPSVLNTPSGEQSADAQLHRLSRQRRERAAQVEHAGVTAACPSRFSDFHFQSQQNASLAITLFASTLIENVWLAAVPSRESPTVPLPSVTGRGERDHAGL